MRPPSFQASPHAATAVCWQGRLLSGPGSPFVEKIAATLRGGIGHPLAGDRNGIPVADFLEADDVRFEFFDHRLDLGNQCPGFGPGCASTRKAFAIPK